MRTTLLIAAVTAFMLSIPHACQQSEQTGRVQFGMALEEAALKTTPEGGNLFQALVSIRSAQGEVVYEKEPVRVYAFGDAYVTTSLTLRVGAFTLTEFMLTDSTGNVLWATPMEGSDLAHLVADPLPVPFEVQDQQTTSRQVEVVRVNTHHPHEFGYVTFDIGFVDRFCLKVHYTPGSMEQWNDSIPDPDERDGPLYQPRLTIRMEGDRVLEEVLNPGLNRYVLPVTDGWYRLTARDCRGMLFFGESYLLQDLLQHRCPDQFPPLEIRHPLDSGVIVTPEGLQEPTITQGVFGRISLQVDGNVSEDGSDIRPVIRDIWFFPGYYLDSIATFAPIDCYFHAGLLPMPPAAIVRSNSDGFFQVPLEAGIYLYAVREGDRFYIDGYISSRKPGMVTVYPQELTELMIHIVDCSMWY